MTVRPPPVAKVIRAALFAAGVLGAPAALMAAGQLDLGKLALILGPAVFGAALARRAPTRRDVRWVGLAALVTLAVAAGAMAAAILAGAARPSPPGDPAAIGASALTSVLEEAGWAASGLWLARGALGRAGPAALGLVWAVWHLVPVAFGIGLFPTLEAAGPAQLAAFVVACVLYRLLLTELQDRAGTWWAAATGHLAPNVAITTAMALGLGGFDDPARWIWFPAPGGLVFPVATAVAIAALRR